MTTHCPACNKSVDPLRSRFVGVVAGKVVAYCSAECANAAPRGTTSPVPAAPSPARSPGVAPRGTTSPEPAAPGPARSASAARVDPATARQAPVASGPEVSPRSEISGSGVATTVDSGLVIEIVDDPEPPSEIVGAAGGERADPDAVADGAVHLSPSADPGSPRESAFRGEPRAKHPDEIAIGAFWSVDKDKSGPVPPIQPARAARDDTLDKWATDETQRGARAASEVDPPDPVRPTSRLPLVIVILLVLGGAGFLAYQYLVKRSAAAQAPRPASITPARRAAAVVEPRAAAALEPRAAAVVEPRVAGVVEPRVAGVVEPRAAASVEPRVAGVVEPRAAAVVEPRVAGVAEPARSAERPVVDVPAVLARAHDVLRGQLAATSQRLQRIAAAALARTSDPAAREVLAAKLGLAGQATGSPPSAGAAREVETSGIARLDLAYSLARSGDKRGSDTLAAALGSTRPEVRDEAARLLALLGDRRAVPHLTDVLAVSERRLGAAEHLAHLAEPHAIKILDQIRSDAKASADDRARAVIALGYAGRADVAPALHDMLDDAHFNAFAAAALAELKDSAARPVLERQLDSPALRVRAARALRRLDPALDPATLLPRLLAVLDAGDGGAGQAGYAGRDIDQVQAAEAILLLAGAPSWSLYE
jgi:HEAT repeat protein